MSQTGELTQNSADELQKILDEMDELRTVLSMSTNHPGHDPQMHQIVLLRAAAVVRRTAQQSKELVVRANEDSDKAQQMLQNLQLSPIITPSRGDQLANERLREENEDLKQEIFELRKEHELLQAKHNEWKVMAEDRERTIERLTDYQTTRVIADQAARKTPARENEGQLRRGASPEEQGAKKRQSLESPAVRELRAGSREISTSAPTPVQKVKVEYSTSEALATMKPPELETEEDQHSWAAFTTQYHELFRFMPIETQQKTLDSIAKSGNKICIAARGRAKVGGRKMGTEERSKCTHCSTTTHTSSYVCAYLKNLITPESGFLYQVFIRS